MRTRSPPGFSPHDGLPSRVRVVELLVPEGQKGIALTDNLTDNGGVFCTVQPGLAARRVHVGVGPEERHVTPSLVPTHQQLGTRSVEETTDVSCETYRVSYSVCVRTLLELIAGTRVKFYQ